MIRRPLRSKLVVTRCPDTSLFLSEVFGAVHVEIRVPAGSIANLDVFMATAKPGDTINAPPAAIGGHVTHHRAGSAGLYGILTHSAPVDPKNYTVDVDALRDDAHRQIGRAHV